LGLFLGTCGSVFLVYWLRWQDEPPAAGSACRALLFTVTLMSVLLAHEMGHWACARFHGFRLSLPWFLPAPVFVGTFGAIIRMREHPRTRTALLEMGAMGPLAGLAVVIPVTGTWLALGGGATVASGDLVLSRPLLWWVLSAVLRGEAPPVAFAVWLGCLLTAMNLIPFGQLDGGHIAGALVPSRMRDIGRVVTATLLLGGLFWPGWAIWAGVLHLLGSSAAIAVRRDTTPPTGRPIGMALASLAAFCLCFTPIPTT
jgi:membrane-associated protease RseP (regulator of RpoE activity)